ncbi:MAG: hypothetical protein ACRC7P_02365 [Enterovibrio sp.]
MHLVTMSLGEYLLLLGVAILPYPTFFAAKNSVPQEKQEKRAA